jgi:hypothetical protein
MTLSAVFFPLFAKDSKTLSKLTGYMETSHVA